MVVLYFAAVLIRRTEEKFDEIEHWTSAERIAVFAPFVAQIRVALVIEHFVCSKVHACV